MRKIHAEHTNPLNFSTSRHKIELHSSRVEQGRVQGNYLLHNMDPLYHVNLGEGQTSTAHLLTTIACASSSFPAGARFLSSAAPARRTDGEFHKFRARFSESS